MIVKSRASAWAQVTPFFAPPHKFWRIIYATGAIEILRMKLRKIINARGHFPSDATATTLIRLAPCAT